MFEPRSALADRIAAGGRDGAAGRRTLRLAELCGWHLAQLAVFAGREGEFAHALDPLLGGDLPTAPDTASIRDCGRLYRIAADRYWIVTADAGLLPALALAVPPDTGTVTPLSCSRTRIALEGPAARTLLARHVAIDLDAAAFRVGQFAQTGLHHTAAMIERGGDDRFELYVLRTYAASTWDWLIDAALPFGYDVRVHQLANTRR